jgi:hypothetical protein
MRFWLIGCGGLLLVFIIVAVIGGTYFYTEMKEMGTKFEALSVEYQALAREFPFHEPEDGLLTSDQVGRFATCRKAVLESFHVWFDQLEDEEVSFFKKIGDSLDYIPRIGQVHVDELRRVGMCAEEYVWVLEQFLLVLKCAEKPDMAQPVKELRLAFDNLPELRARGTKETIAEESEERKFSFSGDEHEFKQLLPPVDPAFVTLLPETVQAVVDHADELKSTLPLLVYFDSAFRGNAPLFAPAAESAEDPALQDGPPPAVSEPR